MYAAGHDGKLPATLADMKEVPIPADPLTGKSFEYTVDGENATLYGPPPPVWRNEAINYQLTLKK